MDDNTSKYDWNEALTSIGLEDLTYFKQACKFLENLDENFEVVYENIKKEVEEKKNKNGNLSDRLENANKVLTKNTKEELKESYLRVKQKFDDVKKSLTAKNLLNTYDDLGEEAYVNLLDKEIGYNNHANAFFNTHLRNYVALSSMVRKKDIAFWSMRSGKNNQYYEDWINNKIISITWDDIESLEGKKEKEVKSYAQDKYKTGAASTFNRFIHKMKIGDIVYIVKKGTECTLAVITSECLFEQSNPSYYINYRTIEILKENVNLEFVKANRSALLVTKKENNLKLLSNELDDKAMEKYDSIIGNIDINRTFKFKIKDNIEQIKVDLDSFVMNSNQVIYDGAPGTGKSYAVNKLTKDKGYVSRITFYQDYENYNFIGNILPVIDGENIKYQFVQGPFTKILDRALSNPREKHFLIIEEMTRGNASAIFGEVFQLLDRDEKSGWSEYELVSDTIYNSLESTSQIVLQEKYEKEVIGIPPNLSIITTINSSDQNVYPLDTAFKRRFIYEIQSTEPNEGFEDFEVKIGSKNYSWKKLYQKLNKYFLSEMGLNEDKQIGPYFIRKNDNKIMVNKLMLYLWNDINKIHSMSGKKIFTKDVLTLSELIKVSNSEQLVDQILSSDFIEFWNKDEE